MTDWYVELDKIAHFFVSFAIALTDPLLAFLLGFGKEVLDMLTGSVFDLADMSANAAGIFTALLVTPWLY